VIEDVQISMPPHNQLWESVLSSLRMAIITGKLASGTHLVEAALADKLHVSRGPVREALVRLEQEGLVVNYPYRGRFVAGLSADDIREIYSLRTLLESYAVELATGKLKAEHLGHLKELLNQMIDLAAKAHFEELADFDLEFHRVFVAAAEHGRLLQMWESLKGVSHALIVITANLQPSIVEVITQAHSGLLEALASDDVVAAKEEIKAYLSRGETLVVQAMEDRVMNEMANSQLAEDTLIV